MTFVGRVALWEDITTTEILWVAGNFTAVCYAPPKGRDMVGRN
jgi:hypothetical protein